MTELKQRIADNIAKHPTRTNWQVAKHVRGANVALVQEVRDSRTANREQEVETTTKGFSLRGARVFSRRPAESAAKYIKRLPTGRGFETKDLAKEWGMSEETILKHARNLGCLRYVEISEDEWLPLILNPETAKQYPA